MFVDWKHLHGSWNIRFHIKHQTSKAIHVYKFGVDTWAYWMGFENYKGEWSVAERTTFTEYLCNERS